MPQCTCEVSVWHSQGSSVAFLLCSVTPGVPVGAVWTAGTGALEQ